MRPFINLVLLWTLPTVWAFRDTSPFFYFTTSEDNAAQAPKRMPDLIQSSSLLQTVKQRLEGCSSDAYVIVSQPGVSDADFEKAESAPRLKRSMAAGIKDSLVRSSFSVSDVIGDFDVDDVQDFLEVTCKTEVMSIDASSESSSYKFRRAEPKKRAHSVSDLLIVSSQAGSFATVEDMKPRVIRVDFPPLATVKTERERQIREHDAFLSSIIDLLPSTKYTALYTTTALSSEHAHLIREHVSQTYQNPLKIPGVSELKHRRAIDDDDSGSKNITLVDGPLFERYQFLTPALFMGLLASFLLITILYVGISALSSLQVSYGAFDKEMGPAAQRKQQ
ncbi:MAG: hypothetical protein M1825_000140 [Sarcosagium campestre]|nr:MAG: hypothetical protein M1825_000140 [Sarcosagium campestre]